MAARGPARGGADAPPPHPRARRPRPRARHFRSIARNTIAMTEYPHRACPIIYFVDAGTQQPERIRNPAGDGNLFAGIPARIAVNFLNALPWRASSEQYRPYRQQHNWQDSGPNFSHGDLPILKPSTPPFVAVEPLSRINIAIRQQPLIQTTPRIGCSPQLW